MATTNCEHLSTHSETIDEDFIRNGEMDSRTVTIEVCDDCDEEVNDDL